jgi:orotidine-5'-phosphate decarboxylase
MDKIIVALDNMNQEEIFSFLDKWKAIDSGPLPCLKVGLELFCLLGPSIVNKIYDKYECEIFLDLKLHDIPQTVRKSIKSLKGLPIKFLTVHLSGGKSMLEMALEEARNVLPNTKLLGVSYLTSLDENDFKTNWGLESKKEVELAFQRLFKLALETKIHGVVSSALELTILSSVSDQFEHSLIKVTPGLRFSDEIATGKIQDQARVLTPQMAIQNGSDYLVIGRSLTQSTVLDKRIEELAEL